MCSKSTNVVMGFIVNVNWEGSCKRHFNKLKYVYSNLCSIIFACQNDKMLTYDSSQLLT